MSGFRLPSNLWLGLALFTTAFAVHPPSTFADTIVPDAHYQWHIIGDNLLDSEAGGPSTIEYSAVNVFRDKVVPFPQGNNPAMAGEATTLTSINFESGYTPFVAVELATTLDNAPINRSASSGGSITYSFAAYRKYTWAPDIPIPLAALTQVYVSANNPANSNAYAETDITYQHSGGNQYPGTDCLYSNRWFGNQEQ